MRKELLIAMTTSAILLLTGSGVTLDRLLTVKYDSANRGFRLDDCTSVLAQ